MTLNSVLGFGFHFGDRNFCQPATDLRATPQGLQSNPVALVSFLLVL